jgi:hypothetical protein
VPPNVTLHEFVHELTHETLHVDGRIFQSVRRLVTSPGFLTREYLEGRRARWISPIRLYLVFSVVYFGLSAFTGLRVGFYESEKQGGWNFSIRRAPQLEDDRNAEDEAKKLGFESVAELREAVNHAILAWIPRVMFVLLPLFAWLVALAYRRVDPNYLHHLIFSVHVHAAWFAAGAAAKLVGIAARPIGQALEQIVLVFGTIYVVLAFRRVYGKVRHSFARIAFVLAVYFAAFVLAFAAVIIPVVFGQFFNRPA